MKKIHFYLFSSLVVFLFLIFMLNKPDEREFSQWLKENYDIRCHDADCYVIELKTEDGDPSERTKLWSSDGYYDTSTGFLNTGMQIKRVYRNPENPKQFFSIEAKGFFGEFEVLEFRQNNVSIQ
jgi:hypothetical protein